MHGHGTLRRSGADKGVVGVVLGAIMRIRRTMYNHSTVQYPCMHPGLYRALGARDASGVCLSNHDAAAPNPLANHPCTGLAVRHSIYLHLPTYATALLLIAL